MADIPALGSGGCVNLRVANQILSNADNKAILLILNSWSKSWCMNFLTKVTRLVLFKTELKDHIIVPIINEGMPDAADTVVALKEALDEVGARILMNLPYENAAYPQTMVEMNNLKLLLEFALYKHEKIDLLACGKPVEKLREKLVDKLKKNKAKFEYIEQNLPIAETDSFMARLCNIVEDTKIHQSKEIGKRVLDMSKFIVRPKHENDMIQKFNDLWKLDEGVNTKKNDKCTIF